MNSWGRASPPRDLESLGITLDRRCHVHAKPHGGMVSLTGAKPSKPSNIRVLHSLRHRLYASWIYVMTPVVGIQSQLTEFIASESQF